MIIAFLQATSSELAYVHSKEYKHDHKNEDGKGDVHCGIEPATLRSTFSASGICFSDVPVPSRSSWVVE